MVSPAEVLGCPGCLPCGYPKHLKWTRTPAFGQLNPARGGLELLIPVGLPPFSLWLHLFVLEAPQSWGWLTPSPEPGGAVPPAKGPGKWSPTRCWGEGGHLCSCTPSLNNNSCPWLGGQEGKWGLVVNPVNYFCLGEQRKWLERAASNAIVPCRKKWDDKNVPEGIWLGNRQQVSEAETAGCTVRAFSQVESDGGRHGVVAGLTLVQAPRDALVVLKVLLSRGEGRQHPAQPGGSGACSQLSHSPSFPPCSCELPWGRKHGRNIPALLVGRKREMLGAGSDAPARRLGRPG